MKYPAFEQAARRAYATIPEQFKEGVDGLVVSRESLPHPTMADVYTLGHCLTEAYASEFAGPDTTRSQVVLYWGSFKGLAAVDPEFDWDEEIWETLTHELRHHLESLAREDGLEGVDYAVDETFKRDDGQAFDPFYYQRGEVLADGVYRVERSFYFEQRWSEDEFAAASWIEWSWHGERWRIPRPDELGDVHFVWITGVDTGPASLELVLVRRTGAWETVGRLFGKRPPVILESEAEAEPVGVGSG